MVKPSALKAGSRGPHFTALCGTYRTTKVHIPHQANFDPFCRLPLQTVPDMYQQSLTSTRTHTPSTWSCPKAASRNDLWRGVCGGETGRLPGLVEGIPPQLNCGNPDGREGGRMVGSLVSCSCLSLFISEEPISNLPRVVKEINLVLSTLLRVDTCPVLKHLLLKHPEETLPWK